MQGASRLAQGCEATENAGGVRGHAPRTFFVIENAKYVISCLFRLYLTPLRKRTIFLITIFYILKFHVWI